MEIKKFMAEYSNPNPEAETSPDGLEIAKQNGVIMIFEELRAKVRESIPGLRES